MTRKTISPVTLEWSEHLLTLRWSVAASVWQSLTAVFFLCFSGHSCFRDYQAGRWAWAALTGTAFLFCFLGLLAQRQWHEKVIVDRWTNRLREWRIKDWSVGTMTQGEHGALETLRAEVFQNSTRYDVVLREAEGQALQMPMLMQFKTRSQAQEVADLLNAFVHQPEVTQTPGVWPPPPRVSGA